MAILDEEDMADFGNDPDPVSVLLLKECDPLRYSTERRSRRLVLFGIYALPAVLWH